MKATLMFATFIISTLPLYAQDQHASIAKLEADAQKVVKIISGDRLKTKTYCEIADLGEQVADHRFRLPIGGCGIDHRGAGRRESGQHLAARGSLFGCGRTVVVSSYAHDRESLTR